MGLSFVKMVKKISHKSNDVKKTITKQSIANAVTAQVGISNSHAQELVELFFKTIAQGLKEDGIVKISRFGTFQILNKKERIGRNPKSMEDAIIKARKVVTFKASDIVRNKLKQVKLDAKENKQTTSNY